MSFLMYCKGTVLKNLGGHLLEMQKNYFAVSTMFFIVQGCKIFKIP